MNMYDALISVVSSFMIWVYIGLFVGVITLLVKIKDILDYFERKILYNKLKRERCIVSNEKELKKLFVLTAKEICIGENIISLSGKELKKISSIKDAPTRLGAENNGVLSFSINKCDGTVYKVLTLSDTSENYYFPIDFEELNRYMKMSSSAFDKYKKITAENWQQL